MDTTSPKQFVFVLMPFTEDFKDIYELGIKQACKDAGAYCERVDEQIFSENILERVYNQIAKADVVVAEMTGRNPNVFYEVGYAHALNKRVILLTQDADDIPFDLKHYPHIVYGGKMTKLKSELETRVRWCIENPTDNLAKVDFSLEFYLKNIALVDSPQIEVLEFRSWVSPKNPVGRDEFALKFQIHNLSEMFDIDSCSIYLCSKNIFNIYGGRDYLEMGMANDEMVKEKSILPDGTLLVRIKPIRSLFPGEWATTIIRFDMLDEIVEPIVAHLAISVFSRLGRKDYPFSIQIPVPDRTKPSPIF